MTAARLLGGRYELADSIGVGGMAEVFRGRDIRLGRAVAVKVLRADLAREPTFQKRFRREAQAAASLAATNIVSVYDTGDEDGVPYIVMELVSGRTLRDILSTEGRLLPQRALEVVADILSALDSAHAASIVHRDIKPANVMLTVAGEVKVMDFGIARAISDTASLMTQTSAVIGTAAYLSPEQARGEHVDARSDLYSTGCLLYELVAGAPPFTGDNPVAVAYQHVREDPRPPSTYDASLPSAIDAIVLKVMAKAPSARYQSAMEMRADLLRCAAGDRVMALPASSYGSPVGGALAGPSLRRPDPHRSRNRALIYGSFGSALIAIIVALALFVQGLLGSSSGLLATPALVGLSEARAVAELAAVGLQQGQITQRFDEKPAGQVLTQTPEAGLLLSNAGSVDLVLSKGIEMTVVPQVLNQSQAEGLAILGNAKLKVDQTILRDGNLAPGSILDILPPPGTQVRAGSSVDLVVASGRIIVPDVRNRRQDQAVQILQSSGFSVGIQQREDTGAAGLVLTQTPVLTVAARGSVVMITVSVPPTQQPEPSPEPSSAPEPGTPPSSPSSQVSPPPPTGAAAITRRRSAVFARPAR